jgi:hypothetical protein
MSPGLDLGQDAKKSKIFASSTSGWFGKLKRTLLGTSYCTKISFGFGTLLHISLKIVLTLFRLYERLVHNWA